MSEKSLVERLRAASVYDFSDSVDMHLRTLVVTEEIARDLQDLAAKAAARIEALEATVDRLDAIAENAWTAAIADNDRRVALGEVYRKMIE